MNYLIQKNINAYIYEYVYIYICIIMKLCNKTKPIIYLPRNLRNTASMIPWTLPVSPFLGHSANKPQIL